MIGTYYVGQVPKDNLVFSVQDQNRNTLSLGGYNTIELCLIDSDNNIIDLTANASISNSGAGTVVYQWPSTSLFNKPGEYEMNLALKTASGHTDFTSSFAIRVKEKGVYNV